MKPAVVHWDINARDAVALQGFYAGVFDWEMHMTDYPNQYAYTTAEELGIGGGIGREPREGEENFGKRHSGLTIFVQVDDLTVRLHRIAAHGGTIIWGPEEVHAGLTLAIFADPEGNRIGLMQRD